MWKHSTIVVALLATATSLQCRKEQQPPSNDTPPVAWPAQQATALTVGPYQVAIPPGWRDMTETPGLPDELRPAPGTFAIVPEAAADKSFGANILLFWTPLPARTEIPTCEALADEIARQVRGDASEIEQLEIDGDRACRWHLTTSGSTGVLAVRFQGDHQLVVQCQRALEGDDDADRTCWTVMVALGFPD